MLVLNRRVGQRVLVGGEIVITVVKVNGGGVRIGFEAPPELPILREELLDRFGLMRESFGDVPEATSNSHNGNGGEVDQNRLRGKFTDK